MTFDMVSFVAGVLATLAAIAIQYGIEKIQEQKQEAEQWKATLGLSKMPTEPRSASREYWGKKLKEYNDEDLERITVIPSDSENPS